MATEHGAESRVPIQREAHGTLIASPMRISRRKLGMDMDGHVEILDVRMHPEELEKLLDGHKYFPGYHMNKKHWCTICLDGTVPLEEICRRIDESFRLAKK